MARRRVDIFSLSFLDAITCGFGAVILLYMVINANVALRADEVTEDLRTEVDRIEEEILDGHRDTVELRNSLREVESRPPRSGAPREAEPQCGPARDPVAVHAARAPARALVSAPEGRSRT